MADIRRDRGLIKDAHRNLRARGLGSHLKVGIAHALSNSVDTNQGTSTQKVLALQRARSHRVLLRPDTVHVFREELRWGELITRVASSRLLGGTKLGRALIRAQISKSLFLILKLLFLILELLFLLCWLRGIRLLRGVWLLLVLLRGISETLAKA